MGFTRNEVTNAPRGLLHLGSILACAALKRPSAVHFCGTILRLAPTGRYPASCLMEPGLSSRGPKPPAIVCQTFRTTPYIISRSLHRHKQKILDIQRRRWDYINRNGSVFTSEAHTLVSYLCSASFPAIHSHTLDFMIFSVLCPGSTSATPAIRAS